MKTFHFAISAIACLCTQAQDTVPLVDMTMSNNRKGQVEFRVRPAGDFAGVVSGLTFTVRWPASAGMALDTAVRCYPLQDVVPVSAVPVVVHGNWMYRTFNGFGLTALSDMGLTWQDGREYPICTADILVPGTTMELVNDEWTSSNNRNYFCSLGGLEAIGSIFPSPEPDVAIRAEDQGTGVLNIILTPQSDFFGWVTDLDFTVRWPAGSGLSLGEPMQDAAVAEYIPIEKIGGEVTAGGFTYQKFHGEGVKSIANSDDAWRAGQDVIVLSVAMFGQVPGIAVVSDDWTSANEGDYSIILNGEDHTGPIEGIALSLPARTADDIRATAFPTPQGFDLMVDLPDGARTASFSLFNAAGQLIWNTIRERAQGRTNLTAATGPIPDGLYILSVRHGERSVTRRVIR